MTCQISHCEKLCESNITKDKKEREKIIKKKKR